jgi:hypothetical protein
LLFRLHGCVAAQQAPTVKSCSIVFSMTDMPGKSRITFETVCEIGLKLPGVQVGTAYGSPMLRVNGRIFTGIAVNRQAEPDSLMVYVSNFQERDALLEEAPDIYYVKPHYESYPVVLVRLRQVTRDALEDLVRGAHRIVSSKPPRRARARKAGGR